MIVAVMGAVFNLIFAFLLSLILWGVGLEIIKSTAVDFVAEEIINAEELLSQDLLSRQAFYLVTSFSVSTGSVSGTGCS